MRVQRGVLFVLILFVVLLLGRLRLELGLLGRRLEDVSSVSSIGLRLSEDKQRVLVVAPPRPIGRGLAARVRLIHVAPAAQPQRPQRRVLPVEDRVGQISVASSAIGLIEATCEGLDVVITLYFRFDDTTTSYGAVLAQSIAMGKPVF